VQLLRFKPFQIIVSTTFSGVITACSEDF